MMLTKKEATERLCKLMGNVACDVYGYAHSADCICREHDMSDGYRNDGVVIQFIERAVADAVKRYHEERGDHNA